MKNSLCILILNLCLLCSCDNEKSAETDLEIINKVSSNLFLFRTDSLKKYSSNDIVLEHEGRTYSREDAFVLLEQGNMNYEMMETKFDSIIIDSNVEGRVNVTSTMSNWIEECFDAPKLVRIDTYYLVNGQINKIVRSAVNREISDSLSIANQQLFFSWARSNNYDSLFNNDGSLNQKNFFSYLKKYCESKNR
ncbi:hypothetical protein [Ekhidna sp.]